MKKQQEGVSAPTRTLEGAAPPLGLAHVARVVSLTPDGDLEIEYQGTVSTARLATAASRDRLETAALLHQPAVVVFEGGDRNKPIVIGLIQAAADPLPAPAPAEATPTVADAPTQETPVPLIEADVDGKRVRVTALDELVLQCGTASITLRRNGRVVIKGAYVETHSDGTNRVRGGQVLIN